MEFTVHRDIFLKSLGRAIGIIESLQRIVDKQPLILKTEDEIPYYNIQYTVFKKLYRI